MSLYRELQTELPCCQCSQPFKLTVQFRSGRDNGESYRDTEPIPSQSGLSTNVTYLGIGDAYCSDCKMKRHLAEADGFYRTIDQWVTSGELTLKTQGWLSRPLSDKTRAAIEIDLKKEIEAKKTNPSPFDLFRQYTILWHGEKAQQGSMAYTNLLEALNSQIKDHLQKNGWSDMGLLRHDIEVTLNNDGYLVATLPTSAATVG